MKTTSFMTASCLMALCIGPTLAQSPQPLLSATVGSGSDESYFVLDFENATATTPDDAYAFGYRYTPPTVGSLPTGFDMIQALSNADIGFSDTSTTYSFGTAIDSFSYNGLSEGGFQSSGYWSYYTSTDSQFGPMSGMGADSRVLSDGSYDGWAWDTGADPTPVTPLVPRVSSAVPEAGSGWLVLFALPLALVARRRVRA